MVRMKVTYEGELRCRATHGPSEAELVTDAPVDNHGRGASFSPTDLLATSLGTCMLTVMGITARTRGWELAGAWLEVEKAMVADPARRVGRLALAFHVPGDWSEEQRATLEKAALGCPVARSIHPDIELPVEFVWGG